ncbi:MAG: hypothetical protein QXE01_04935 [Sulfolobales archaeon]
MSVETLDGVRTKFGVMDSTEVSGEGFRHSYPLDLALRILDLVRIKGEVDSQIFSTMGFSKEFRIYMSKWISSLRNFKYDHQFSSYLVANGIPEHIFERVISNLEDLTISTTIILTEERVTLTDAITYMGILRRVLNSSDSDSIFRYIVGDGRLSNIASRVALLILFVLSIYMQDELDEIEV